MAHVEAWPDKAYRLYFKKMLETQPLRPKIPEVFRQVEAAKQQDTESRYILWEKKITL